MSDKELDRFDAMTRELAIELRKWLSQAEDIHNMDFQINIGGRIDGDLKIEYRMSLNYEGTTKSGQLRHLIAEALRRYSWNQNHAPICISKVDNGDSDQR